MSYMKVKSISLKPKDNKIMVNCASSNCFPITYYNSEFMKDSDKSFNEKLGKLLRDISGGNLHLNTSMYKWNYAIYQTNKELERGNEYSGIKTNGASLYDKTSYLDTIYYIGTKPYTYYQERQVVEITQEQADNGDYVLDYEYKEDKQYYNKAEREQEKQRIDNEIKKYVDTFMKYFNEKISGKYYLKSPNKGIIKPKGTNGSFYYNLGESMIEPMDYYQAFILAKQCERENYNIEVKKIPTREYIPTDSQNKEVEKRLDILGLSKGLKLSDKYTIRTIRETEIDLISAINDFETTHKAIVYHIIYTNTNFGEVYTMLYVSNYESEWELDIEDLERGELYAYAYNKTTPYCSEIGLVGINKDNKPIERVY